MNKTTEVRTSTEKNPKYMRTALQMAKNRITKNRKAKEQALKKKTKTLRSERIGALQIAHNRTTESKSWVEDSPGKSTKGPHSKERKEPCETLNRTEPHRTRTEWKVANPPPPPPLLKKKLKRKRPHTKEPYEVLKGRQSLRRTTWWKKTC